MIFQSPTRPIHLTYCSNLHPIEKPDALEKVAQSIWPKVAARLRTTAKKKKEPFDLGPWFSEESSHFFSDEQALAGLEATASQFNGQFLTANAFPMGEFHSDVVKEEVYLPDWQDDRRLAYTQRVAKIMASLPTTTSTQSVSTLPGSFKTFPGVDDRIIAANLLAMAKFLSTLEKETGRHIILGVEPEPGCLVETTEEWIEFFEAKLLRPNPDDEEILRRYIGTCFDCCHQAVQYESPARSLKRLRGAGIRIAKVQLSSALQINEPAKNPEAIGYLSKFAENRYLHQVVAKTGSNHKELFVDLPTYLAVADLRRDTSARIHFHVPIYLDKVGPLQTTRKELQSAIAAVVKHEDCDHFEIETYSWGVMPERRNQETNEKELIDDIVAEYEWASECIKNVEL